MRRSAPATLAIPLALSVVATAVAQDVDDRIDLPDGWCPVRVAADGSSMYVGSLADSALWTADPATVRSYPSAAPPLPDLTP